MIDFAWIRLSSSIILVHHIILIMASLLVVLGIMLVFLAVLIGVLLLTARPYLINPVEVWIAVVIIHVHLLFIIAGLQ